MPPRDRTHSQEPDLSVCMYVQDIEKALEPVLYMYKQRRRPGEALGDFTARIGFETLRQYAQVTFLLRLYMASC